MAPSMLRSPLADTPKSEGANSMSSGQAQRQLDAIKVRDNEIATPVRPMKERPILFSAPMVRAVLDGTKTQTRRVVKSPHVVDLDVFSFAPERGEWEGGICVGGNTAHGEWICCPYGVPGDRLWVRETWQPVWATEDRPPHGLASAEGWRIGYVATDGVQEFHDMDDGLVVRSRPSIHMPRWASRITLEITSIRVERLQAITEEDARAEGLEIVRTDPEVRYAGQPHNPGEWRSAVRAFEQLWSAINGERASWSSNPWVWALSFKRVEAGGEK
jgi:hypothetical protein